MVWGYSLLQLMFYLYGMIDGCYGMWCEQVVCVFGYCGLGLEVELIEGVGYFMLVEWLEEINDCIFGFLEWTVVLLAVVC